MSTTAGGASGDACPPEEAAPRTFPVTGTPKTSAWRVPTPRSGRGVKPLGEDVKKIEAKKTEGGKYAKSAAGWACVEALAVYCVGTTP